MSNGIFKKRIDIIGFISYNICINSCNSEQNNGMKKTLFIIGTILFALSVLAFSFGTYLLFVSTHAETTGEAIAAVVLIPLAVIAYSVQAALCVGTEITLWINFKKGGACRIASMVIAIICLALIVASVSYFSYLLIISN